MTAMKNQNMNVMTIEINRVCPFWIVIMRAISGSIFTLVIGVFILSFSLIFNVELSDGYKPFAPMIG